MAKSAAFLLYEVITMLDKSITPGQVAQCGHVFENLTSSSVKRAIEELAAVGEIDRGGLQRILGQGKGMVLANMVAAFKNVLKELAKEIVRCNQNLIVKMGEGTADLLVTTCNIVVDNQLRTIFSIFTLPYEELALTKEELRAFARQNHGVFYGEDYAMIAICRKDDGTLVFYNLELNDRDQLEEQEIPPNNMSVWLAEHQHQILVPTKAITRL